MSYYWLANLIVLCHIIILVLYFDNLALTEELSDDELIFCQSARLVTNAKVDLA